MLALALAQASPTLPLRGVSHLKSLSPIIDLLYPSALLFMRLLSQASLAFSVFGMACARLSLIILEFMCTEAALFLHSCACLAAGLSASDAAHVSSSSTLKNFTYMRLSPLAIGMARFNLALVVLSYTNVSSPLSLQGAFCLSIVSSSLKYMHVSLPTSLRHYTHLNASPALPSIARFESPMFALDFASMGTSSMFRSCVRLSVALLASDFAHSASALLLRSPELSLLLAEHAHSELVLPSRSYPYSSPTVMLFGLARPSPVFFLPVSDLVSLRLFLSLRSCNHLKTTPTILDFLHSEFAVSSHSLPCLSIVVLSLGMSRPRSISSPLMLDSVHFNPSLLLRSLTRLGVMLAALDGQQLSPPLLSQYFAQPRMVPTIIDYEHINSSSLLRFFSHTGLALSILGSFRVELLLLVPDVSQPSTASFLQNFACPSMLLSASDSVSVGLSLPLQSTPCLSPFFSALGMAWAELALFASQCSVFGSASLLRGFVHLGLASLLLDEVHAGSLYV